MVTRGLAAGPALLSLLAAGGCSDGNESAQASEGQVATTAPSPVPATDIAGRPLTTTTQSAPATTTAVTVASTSTSTTTPVPPGNEAALEAAVGTAELALLNALRDPDSEQLFGDVEAATVPDSPARSELTSRYGARVGAGQALEPSLATPSTVMLGSVDYFVEGQNRAVVTVCVVDGDALVRRQMIGDDEEVVVIDEEPASARFVETFALVDQQWKLESRVIRDYFSGGTSCPTS